MDCSRVCHSPRTAVTSVTLLWTAQGCATRPARPLHPLQGCATRPARPLHPLHSWPHLMTPARPPLATSVTSITSATSVTSASPLPVTTVASVTCAPLAQHNLIYTLDHSPACGDLNVGFAYCQGCASKGRAQWVLDEGLRRVGYFCGGDPKEFQDGGRFWNASDASGASKGPHHWQVLHRTALALNWRASPQAESTRQRTAFLAFHQRAPMLPPKAQHRTAGRSGRRHATRSSIPTLLRARAVARRSTD